MWNWYICGKYTWLGFFVLCQTNNKIAIFGILTLSIVATEAYRGIRLSFGPRLQLEKRTCSPGGRVVAGDAGRKRMNRNMLTIIANTYFLSHRTRTFMGPNLITALTPFQRNRKFTSFFSEGILLCRYDTIWLHMLPKRAILPQSSFRISNEYQFYVENTITFLIIAVCDSISP